MKTLAVIVIVAAAWVVLYGSPIIEPLPPRQHYYGSPEPILAMTFAHADHSGLNCAQCHHNFVDGSGSGPCMNCHVATETLMPVLQEQFHELCRGCHIEKVVAGEAAGPTRRCVSCHLEDGQF